MFAERLTELDTALNEAAAEVLSVRVLVNEFPLDGEGLAERRLRLDGLTQRPPDAAHAKKPLGLAESPVRVVGLRGRIFTVVGEDLLQERAVLVGKFRLTAQQ